MTRDEAFAILTEYTKKENLIKHALAVEAAMRRYAEIFGEDPEEWGIVGLLHDFDYEKFPDNHPYKGVEILKEKDIPEEWLEAILGHADYTGVERKTLLAKTLFAVDELTGFIVAVALVRPSKKIEDVAVKSVKKKMKDKAFAAAVNREDIVKGADELNISLEEHIKNVLEAMKAIAQELGL
ncbi:MAG TPA: HD domain-containing protein [candidate division WOR-3 bacterium]|uniref:HD domain-containing protein n=1 Tax=candidate division WOR-3 bacterium TaxID=2052148 RepID=A0A7C5DH82_UNCW3|nr:HD domain-containing protein [candidate division WOR-3 bacterium]